MVRAVNPPQDERIQRLLKDAALFNLMARAFCYPSACHHAEVSAAFSRVRASQVQRTRLASLGQLLSAAQRAWQAADPALLQADYTRLFLRNAPCPLHETAYGDGRRIAGRAVELADTEGFYTAFGFGLTGGNPDLPDHLCTEVEFYSLLLVKQGYALHSNWPMRYQVSRRAAAVFLEQHLGRWGKALTRRLQEHQAAVPYLKLSRLLAAVIDRECKRLRLMPQRVEDQLPHDEMQAESFVCP